MVELARSLGLKVVAEQVVRTHTNLTSYRRYTMLTSADSSAAQHTLDGQYCRLKKSHHPRNDQSTHPAHPTHTGARSETPLLLLSNGYRGATVATHGDSNSARNECRHLFSDPQAQPRNVYEHAPQLRPPTAGASTEDISTQQHPRRGRDSPNAPTKHVVHS